MNAIIELCPPDSLKMPVVVPVKILAMRLGHEDRWCLAHFRTIVISDPYTKVSQRWEIKEYEDNFMR